MPNCSKSLELDNELRMVGNNLKSLEANEEKVCLLMKEVQLLINFFNFYHTYHFSGTNA